MKIEKFHHDIHYNDCGDCINSQKRLSKSTCTMLQDSKMENSIELENELENGNIWLHDNHFFEIARDAVSMMLTNNHMVDQQQLMTTVTTTPDQLIQNKLSCLSMQMNTLPTQWRSTIHDQIVNDDQMNQKKSSGVMMNSDITEPIHVMVSNKFKLVSKNGLIVTLEDAADKLNTNIKQIELKNSITISLVDSDVTNQENSGNQKTKLTCSFSCILYYSSF